MAPVEPETTFVRRRRWIRLDRARAVGGDVWLLAAGTFVSMAGDAAAMIALLLRLRPAGAGWVAALLGAELVPAVIASHWTGRLVDSHDKRRLLILALSGQALVSVPLALFSSPWLTVALFLLLSTLGALVRPATSALVPALTGEERKLSGYAWIATGSSLGFIIGPALGGLLTGAFGARSALLADAATFVVLTLACARIRTREAPRTQPLAKGRGSGGVSLVWRDVVLRTSIVVTAVAIGCAVVDNVAAPYRFIGQLGTTSFGYGLYLGLWGVGALIGAQLARRGSNTALVLAIGNLFCALGIAGIGLAPDVVVAYLASVAGGVGNGLANVSLSALVTSRISAPARGRAFAATAALIQGANGLGTAAAAPLVTVFGAGHAMAGAGGLAAVAALGAVRPALTKNPAARSMPEAVLSV